MRCGRLTLAVVDVDNGISIAQRLCHAPDEPLSALGGSVDSDEAKGTLGSRHDDCADWKRKREGRSS